MLTVHNLSKSFGITPILKDISFSINPGQKVGLIGPNGCGKSTLLRLLIGQEKVDNGHISIIPPELRIGYLAQGFEPDPELTTNQMLHKFVGDPEILEAQLAQLAIALSKEPDSSAIQKEYDTILTKINRHNTGQVQSILASLELDAISSTQKIGTLSGGQKTRLALALVLMNEPDFLIFDEPTNHLDIEMLGWLEDWINSFSGGILIVSHDRTFLDRTVNIILDLDPHTQNIRQYSGNYSAYLIQYLKEQEKQTAAYKDQVYEIRRMRQDIQRTMEQARSVEKSTTPRQPNVRRYAKKVAKKAKSREKKLERYLASDERVEKPVRSWRMKMDLGDTPHLGRDVLHLVDLAVGYQGNPTILHNLNQQVQSGQRIVLTGPNGKGKTTLLRTITGQLPPLAGRYRIGSTVKLGYMIQEQELIDPESNPLTTIRQVAEMNQTEARSFLHYFLFSGDDPLRPNYQLSFGERARLSLAKLVAAGCNFLILDEPINHLDIPSRERFEQALSHFDGTILAVIHDRYFIARFATDLWIVENHQLRVEILRQ